jgi:hypothetical protein
VPGASRAHAGASTSSTKSSTDGVGGVDEVTALDPFDPGCGYRSGHEVRHLHELRWGILGGDAQGRLDDRAELLRADVA